MAAGLFVILGVAAAAAAAKGAGGAKQKKQTTGTALLKGGRIYRIELEVSGRGVSEAPNPAHAADAVRNGLGMGGARDVYVSPTNPIQASYTLPVAYDTPVVLNVSAQQMIGGLPADYVFRSVQQLS